jgi:hypothetical protein
MNKLLPIAVIAAFLISTMTMAQSSRQMQEPVKNLQPAVKTNQSAAAKDFNNPLWESDFSDPTDWVTGTQPNADEDDQWVIGTMGSSGPFEIGTINSTTADNGFALYDSDLMCSGNQDAWIATAEAIDISSSNDVSLQFESYFRDFLGACFVETSVDGEFWEPIEILDLEVNETSPNPELITMALPGLSGQDQGFIRFRYEGGCDYAWMIDDVKIAATPEFDIAIGDVWYDEFILTEDPLLNSPDDPTPADMLNYLSNLEYSSYSVGNVRPLTFIAVVQNFGINEMTGITLQVTLNTPDGQETFLSDPLASLASLASDTIIIEDVFPAAFADGGLVGDYTVEFTVFANEEESDNTNNDSNPKFFSVNEEYMENADGDFYQTTAGQTFQDFIYANQFTVEESGEINYIQFGLDDEALFENIGQVNTIAGEDIWINFRSGSVVSPEGPDNPSERFFGEEELVYNIAEADISTAGQLIWITYILPEPVAVEPGTIYQAEVEAQFLGQNYCIIAGTIPQEQWAGLILDKTEPNPNTPQGWSILGRETPTIRAGFNPSVGVDAPSPLNFKLGQNYPNPSFGQTRIDWELTEPAENVQFRITDINGKTVYQLDLGDRPAGVQESLELNLNLAAGNYQYGMQIGDVVIVRKMVITK